MCDVQGGYICRYICRSREHIKKPVIISCSSFQSRLFWSITNNKNLIYLNIYWSNWNWKACCQILKWLFVRFAFVESKLIFSEKPCFNIYLSKSLLCTLSFQHLHFQLMLCWVLPIQHFKYEKSKILKLAPLQREREK